MPLVVNVVIVLTTRTLYACAVLGFVTTLLLQILVRMNTHTHNFICWDTRTYIHAMTHRDGTRTHTHTYTLKAKQSQFFFFSIFIVASSSKTKQNTHKKSEKHTKEIKRSPYTSTAFVFHCSEIHIRNIVCIISTTNVFIFVFARAYGSNHRPQIMTAILNVVTS